MKTYPGIVTHTNANGTWIRPNTGGHVCGPPTIGLKRGDKIEYTINGQKKAVLDIFKQERVLTLMNPPPTCEKGGWHKHDWNYNDDLWVVPIWDFQDTTL